MANIARDWKYLEESIVWEFCQQVRMIETSKEKESASATKI
jgi:hypothetical protein